ncbi:MAG: hypothetical protein Q9177_002003, partial [Variospora cf. flavescens]
MSELAESISENTRIVDTFFLDHNLSAPSFDTGSPLKVVINDEKVAGARFAAIAAMHELKCLMLGPTESLMSVESEDMLSLQAIYRYQIDQNLGIGEQISFETLSARCALNVIDLQRILRYAMTNFVFYEPQPGLVAHTSLSKALAQDVRLRSYIEQRPWTPCSDMVIQAVNHSRYVPLAFEGVRSKFELEMLRLVGVLKGFALSQNTDKGLYEELHQHPVRQRRWTNAMSAIASQKDFEFILDSFDWLRYTGGTVVDVGGGSGTISEGLALRLPGLNFIVQDHEEVIRHANVNPKLKGRIEFMPYSFFDEQPAKYAEVYYFRNIFHNWPDEQCVIILQKLIPALKPGAHIIIDDFGLQAPLILPAYQERTQR